MVKLERSALVPYSASQMFDLVNDIEQYPQFMQGCKSASVISCTEGELVGELCLAKAGISHRFTTRNTLTRPVTIEMQLVSCPLDFYGAGGVSLQGDLDDGI